MIAFYRKELRLGFSSLSTYVLFTVLLLSFGVLSTVFNLLLGYSSLSYPLGYMTLFLALTLPFFPFFSTKREYKGSTSSLLLSLPVSPAAAVVGSFFGQSTLLLIPTAVLSLFPVLFFFLGSTQIASSETALLGYFLYALLLLSLNRLLFSAIRRPWISLAVSLLSNLFLYFLNTFYFYVPLDGIPESVSSLFNPTGIYYSFTYGKINLGGILYFVTLTALLVFCDVLLKKRERLDFSNKKRRLRAACVLSSLLLCFLLCNLLFPLLPEKSRNLDVTGNDVFRVSNATVSTLNSLDAPVEIFLLSAGGKNAADKDFLSFLRRYEDESRHLTLTVIDTEKHPDFSSAYSSDKLSDQSLIIQGNNRFRVLDRADLYHYESPTVGSLSSADYEYLLQSYITYMQTGSLTGLSEQSVALGQQLYFSTDTVAFFDGDSALCNAIRFVSDQSIPTVYFAVNDTFIKTDGMLENVLTENGFFVKHTNTVTPVPEDCDALVLFSPKKDITAAEKESLAVYLAKGGKLFLTTDYTKTELPVLLSLLSEYGMSTATVSNIVCDAKENTHVSNGSDSDYFFLSKITSCPATGSDFSGSYASILSHSVFLKETAGVTHTAWMNTSDKGYLYDPLEEEIIEEGRYCCGAIAEKENASTVIWIPSPLSVSSTGYVASEGGNFLLFLSSFRWMCGGSFEKISIASTTLDSSTLNLTDGDVAIWTLVIAVLLPIIPISIGIIYTYVRKKR